MGSGAHTPGPWHVGADWPQLVAIYDDTGLYIAHAVTGVGGDWINGENPIGEERAQANAALMATAPDLADALEAIAVMAETRASVIRMADAHQIGNFARAALAKARPGEEPSR